MDRGRWSRQSLWHQLTGVRSLQCPADWPLPSDRSRARDRDKTQLIERQLARSRSPSWRAFWSTSDVNQLHVDDATAARSDSEAARLRATVAGYNRAVKCDQSVINGHHTTLSALRLLSQTCAASDHKTLSSCSSHSLFTMLSYHSRTGYNVLIESHLAVCSSFPAEPLHVTKGPEMSQLLLVYVTRSTHDPRRCVRPRF